MRAAPWVGLSLMLEDDFRDAATPLLAAGEVDALEWSFDTGWGRPCPAWADALLAHYGEERRLYGHGVEYSPLSAVWEPRQEEWLAALAHEVKQRRYVHVSEHDGFMTAPPFVRSAPLPTPRCAAARRIARDRLRRLRDVVGVPVGLENLALTWRREDAIAQGAWLEELLPEPDDFLLLDLHNVHCQAENFAIDAEDLLAGIPVHRVRELHVSGGSFLPAWPDGKEVVRCDTHDGAVPEPVFALLELALARFPRIEVVIVERLGGTLRTGADAETFRADFRRVRLCAQARSEAMGGEPAQAETNAVAAPTEEPADEAALARYQSALVERLTEPLSASQLRARLAEDPAFGAPFRGEVDGIDERALGIAARVVKKYALRG